MRNRSVAWVFLAFVVACGGSGEGSTGSQTAVPSDVARTEGGEAITAADGSAVSKKAHSKWAPPPPVLA